MNAPNVLLIDNLDSFTFNIADLLHRVLGQAPTLWRHDHPATQGELLAFDAIVVGPGPGRPQHGPDLGISALALGQRQVPVLGICLGHQGLAHLAGDDVVEMGGPMHGRVSSVYHDGSGILAGIPSPFRVVRYHSLEVVADSSVLRPAAWASDDGCVMVLSDPDRRRFGVQFHPESVLSEHGERLVANFFRVAGVEVAAADPASRPAGSQPGCDNGPVALGDAPVAHQRSDERPPRTVQVRAERLGAASDVDAAGGAAALAEALMDTGAPSAWLDSSAGEARGSAAADQARFSVVAVADGPWSAQLTYRVGPDGGAQIRRVGGEQPGQGRQEQRRSGPLLEVLQGWLDEWEVADRAAEAGFPGAFRPGFVGYLGYELRAETAPDAGVPPPSPTPDASLLFVDRAVVIDHVEGGLWAIWLEDDTVAAQQRHWLAELRAVLAGRREGNGQDPTGQESNGTGEAEAGRSVPQPDPAEVLARVERGMVTGRADYLEAVRQCQRLIRAGESYEMCLTTAVRWPEADLDEAAVYRELRRVSPVPFGLWLRTPELSVLGASPERFLSVDADGAVQTRPIKGTRGRDADPEVDAALAMELAGSVKDRAENLMIVDLLRNDLHRVCRSGSVRVPELFAVESYATVHQLVSTITGRLADGMSAVDLLASCFPGGSMTGAPKVRTMRLLHELERRPRGVYAGAAGWIGVTGAMDTSIVIRTVTLSQGRAQFGIGGAITALSDPDEEYDEILHKARGPATALAAAGVPCD